MAHRIYTGDPHTDAIIARQVRYGQTRWAEVWLSLCMVTLGIVLLSPEPTFTSPSYRIIAQVVTEPQAGLISLGCGSVRLLAIWINGRRGRQTSLVRTLGCIAGFFFWLAVAVGFMLAVPPLSTGVAIYPVLALAELHSSGRAAGDMAAEDTFGLRKRRYRRKDEERAMGRQNAVVP